MNEAKLAEIGALKSKLITFPRGLYEARQRQFDVEQRVKALQGEIKDAEMEALLIASAKTGPDNKPAYTNEQSRKAAASKALADSATHRDCLKRLNDAETEAMNAKLEVARLEDEQRAWRAVADVTCAEVSLLVAGR